jgi:hypothetical protein
VSGDDIVQRLRRWDGGISTHWVGCFDSHPVCAIRLAADAIEARDAEIERLRAQRDAERALADQLHNALCLVAVDLSGPKTAAAVAAYAAARNIGSASATDVGAQP